jgi:hypothetical protein
VPPRPANNFLNPKRQVFKPLDFELVTPISNRFDSKALITPINSKRSAKIPSNSNVIKTMHDPRGGGVYPFCFVQTPGAGEELVSGRRIPSASWAGVLRSWSLVAQNEIRREIRARQKLASSLPCSEGQSYKTKHIATYWAESPIAFCDPRNLQYVSSREMRFNLARFSVGAGKHCAGKLHHNEYLPGVRLWTGECTYSSSSG